MFYVSISTSIDSLTIKLLFQGKCFQTGFNGMLTSFSFVDTELCFTSVYKTGARVRVTMCMCVTYVGCHT